MKIKFTKLLVYCITIGNSKCHLRNFLGVFLFLFAILSGVYAQNVGFNTTGAAANSKALLDVNADNASGEKKGLLLPRMTTTERNTLSSSGTMPESLLLYNTTTQCFETWNQSTVGWVVVRCLNCHMPGIFAATSSSNLTATSFNANWTASTLATGYYLDVSTSSTFASFVTGYNNLSVSNVLTYSVTGLTASTTYYYRVRAINACGTTTNSNTITRATIANTTPLSAGCNTAQVDESYGTVVTSISGTSQTWITRNLGATTVASSSSSTTNAEAGCYFQFNRSQAYGFDNGGSVNPAWTITTIAEATDWLVANDPCRLQLGGSWRLPTYTEWNNADVSQGWWSHDATYSSVLKIHAAGFLSAAAGALGLRGTNGLYWSSTTSGGNGRSLSLSSGGCSISNAPKANGYTVRCLK